MQEFGKSKKMFNKFIAIAQKHRIALHRLPMQSNCYEYNKKTANAMQFYWSLYQVAALFVPNNPSSSSS